MSSEASDRPSIGSPGGWYPRFDGSNPPRPRRVEPILKERPAVAVPVMPRPEVVRHLPECQSVPLMRVQSNNPSPFATSQ